MTVLEIAVQDARGARIAREAGADRVELCAALGLTGGITPSIATVEAVVAEGLPVHVLVRTRPGGFVYTAEEVEVMARDIELVIEAGASGVVIGALNPDLSVDHDAVRTWLGVARLAGEREGRNVEVTFHRALDVVPDPVAVLRELAGLGVDRVLTSGGAAAAPQGVGVLRALAEAGTGVQVQVGGGVTIESIPELVALGVDGIHLSAKRVVPDPGPVGPGGGEPGGLEETSPEIVAAAVAALRAR